MRVEFTFIDEVADSCLNTASTLHEHATEAYKADDEQAELDYLRRRDAFRKIAEFAMRERDKLKATTDERSSVQREPKRR